MSPDMFEQWMEALLSTVEQHGPNWSPQVELAWRITLAPGLTYMKNIGLTELKK